MIKIMQIPFIQKLYSKCGSKIFVLIGMLGVFLIFLSENSSYTDSRYPNENGDISLYKENLKNEITQILSSVEGVGKVQVMITLEAGEENIYAWQEKTSNNRQINSDLQNNQSTYENRIVTVSDGGKREALVEKTLQPSVQGVIVVCEGADNIQTVSNITNAVSVVLNIPSNRICVIKMQ